MSDRKEMLNTMKINCPNCNAENGLISSSCYKCGADLIEYVKENYGELYDEIEEDFAGIECPICGTKNEMETNNCINCDHPLYVEEEEMEIQEADTAVENKENSSSMTQSIITAIIVIAIFLLLSVVLRRH